MDENQITNSLRALPGEAQLKAADRLKQFTLRKLTLKGCLPELPAKTYYTWVDEGLIPQNFGRDLLTEGYNNIESQGSYKKWNRFNAFEFFWIRLVYHLRQAGHPKENIKANAKLLFTPTNEELLKALLMKVDSRGGEFEKRKFSLEKKIGKKSAQHEVEKILQFTIESTTFTQFHFDVIDALISFHLPYFVATTQGAISSISPSKLSEPERSSYGPFLAIPYSLIINDLVSVSEKEYLNCLFGLDINTGMVIDTWKQHTPALELAKMHKAEQEKLMGSMPGLKTMEAIFNFCAQIAALKNQVTL